MLPYLHEPLEYRTWFLKILRQGNPVFIDVGAYIGGYSVRACKLGAKVIAIEPDKENYSLLLRNLELNDCTQVHILNVAAGAKEGVLPLYALRERYRAQCYSLVKGETLRDYIRVFPLDELIPPLLDNYREIHLVKIDVEGFECETLEGMENLSKKTRYIMIEVLPANMNEAIRKLSRLGFKVIDYYYYHYPWKRYNLLLKRVIK